MDMPFKGWFTEKHDRWSGEVFSMEMENVLHHEKSQYQDIIVFQSKAYGRVLALDGILQLTDRDECAYHEMIAHIPLFSHPNPKNVLVVGGGDGGVLREIAKHSCVNEIHLCEIDERVVEISKQYLPQQSCGYSDPRVQVHIQDGEEFIAQHKQKFDIIITDSSDPVGPGECLFQQPYYEKVKEALTPGGIHCAQGDCIWVDLKLIRTALDYHRKIFPVVSYAVSSVPIYATIGFILASLNPDTVFEQPLRALSEAQVEEMGLQYYNSDVHNAAFGLPQFARKGLHPTQ